MFKVFPTLWLPSLLVVMVTFKVGSELKALETMACIYVKKAFVNILVIFEIKVNDPN